jgi:hypothetical protein
MPVWVRTVDGRTERVVSATDDESTAQQIVGGSMHPYSQGWVQIDHDPAMYVQLSQVVSIEIRAGAVHA